MPVQIGAQAHNFSDPTGLLSDCHRRIEMFLGALERVATVVDRPLTEETRAALESALRYFREAAPKHTADEEESLFPRLRQIHLPDVETAIEALEPLEHDHLLAGSLHAEVEELGQRYLATESLEATDVKTFRKAIARSCLYIQAAHQHRGRACISSGSTTPVFNRESSHCRRDGCSPESKTRRLDLIAAIVRRPESDTDNGSVCSGRFSRCKRSIISISLFALDTICMYELHGRSISICSAFRGGRRNTQRRGILAQLFIATKEGKSLSGWRRAG